MKSNTLCSTVVSSVSSDLLGTIPPSSILELTDLFLALAWDFAYRTSDIAEIPGGKQKLFFTPLGSSIRFEQGKRPNQANECSLSVTSFVLQFLVFSQESDLSDLFLDPLSVELQTVLKHSNFKDERSPLVVNLNSSISKYFVQRRTSMSPCVNYWENKSLFAMRAINFLSNKKDWALFVTRAIYQEHIKLQGHNPRLGMGLVTLHQRSS